MTRRGFGHVTFVSAGAGSGKTYRLTQELERALVDDGIDPAGVIATTFTVKAAGELNDRVRERLVGAGQLQLAERMSQALVGTVHSVCERLLNRFAFELGLSPQLNVLGVEDDRLFRQALDRVVDLAGVQTMNALARRLSVERWQDDVKAIADRARDNAISATALPPMAVASADALLTHFPAPQPGNHLSALRRAVARALQRIDTVDPQIGYNGLKFKQATIIQDQYAPGAYGVNDADLGSYYASAGETFWWLNPGPEGEDAYINLYFAGSPKYQFGFSGFKVAQDSSQVAGQIFFGGTSTVRAPRLMRCLYGGGAAEEDLAGNLTEVSGVPL